MVRVHFMRLIESKSLYFSLLIGLLITTGQYVFVSLDVRSFTQGVIPKSSYLTWLGANGFDQITTIFLFILPILAALPYGAQLQSDIHYGYYELSSSKISKRKYLSSIYIVNAIAGFLAIIIPVMFNFFLHSLTYKAIVPNPMLYYGYVPEQNTTLSNYLFFNHPFINTLMYIVLFGLVGSAMAMLSLSSGFFTKKKLIIFSIPFAFQLILFILPTDISLNPMEFLPSVSTRTVQFEGVIGFFLGILFLCSIFIYLGKRRNEI